MRLSTQGSQFVFNLPTNIVTEELNISYAPMLEKNWIQYDSVIDYLNSTIMSITLPGLSIDTPKQTIIRGKELHFKPAKNIHDITTNRQFQITFRSVDSDLNYFLLYDIFMKHYLDVENLYIFDPFVVTALDIYRDAIYKISFYDIIFTSLSDNTFAYNQQKLQAKQFTLTCQFNFYRIDYLMDNSRVLELRSVEEPTQRIKFKDVSNGAIQQRI